MNLQNIIQNKYIQATGALFVVALVFWFVTGSDSPEEVVTSVPTTEKTIETHKVSAQVNDDSVEVVVEADKPATSDNTDNDITGEE